MHDNTLTGNMTRTYPQPDSPRHLAPRDRALAIFYYLYNAEPEAAVRRPEFGMVEHAFAQAGRAGAIGALMRRERVVSMRSTPFRWLLRLVFRRLDPAFDVPQMRASMVRIRQSSKTIEAPLRMFSDGHGE